MGLVFDAYFDVPPGTVFDVTLKAQDDSGNPYAIVELLEPFTFGEETTLTLTTGDDGWGLKTVEAWISTDNGDTWSTIDSGNTPVLWGEEYDINIPEEEYQVVIPALSEGDTLIVKAKLTDYAGITATIQSPDLAVPPVETYMLSIESDPDVEITVDGESADTPYSATLEEGEYTVEVPAEFTVGDMEYEFQQWSDGATDTERTLTLDTDTALTLEYLGIEVQEPEPPEDEKPAGGIPVPDSVVLLGVLLGAVIVMQRTRKTPLVQM